MRHLLGTRTRSSVFVGLVLWSLSVPALSQAAPRWFLKIRGIEMAPEALSGSIPHITQAAKASAPAAAEGTSPPPAATVIEDRKALTDVILSIARAALDDELKKRNEVVVSLDNVPPDAPAGQLAGELKRRALKGYEVTLRVLKVERALRPPPQGRKFRLLEESVKLSLVGTLYPDSPQLALGGEGESAVQFEVGVQISENQERDALDGAIKDAVNQAVSQALRKLAIGPQKPPKDPPRRRLPPKK